VIFNDADNYLHIQFTVVVYGDIPKTDHGHEPVTQMSIDYSGSAQHLERIPRLLRYPQFPDPYQMHGSIY
jgi:hypothetical protein